MKRLISFICSILLVIGCMVPCVSGAEYEDAEELVLVRETVAYLEDGSRIITSVYEEATTTRSNLYNKTGSRIDRYVDAGGAVLWSLTVHGEFRILEGASVTCISATCSSEVYNSDWTCTRKTATPSGSWTIANGEFAKTLLGIVVSRESVEVSLTCDVYGNLS